jgi:hypothetical protein
MTIVRNYSDLSPAMRSALLEEATTKRQVADALVRRNMVTVLPSRRGLWPLELTEAGRRAADHIRADVPTKVAPIIDRAREAGLDVARSEESGTLKSWTISSPNPVDNTQIWLYWAPAARGGRLGATLYFGSAGTKRNTALRMIYITIGSMADSLRRHHDREAARQRVEHQHTQERMAEAQAALAQVFTELDGAEIPSDEETRAAEACGLTVTQLRAKRAEIADEMVDMLRTGEAKNLLHEELNLSTVHAADETGQPLCRPHGVLANEMTLVDYPVDCRACLAQRTLECGCPAQLVADEGHQEGCSDTTPVLGDPARPGWFLVGQHIYDHQADVHAQVAEVCFGATGQVAAVSVTINGGHGGKWHWYGEHPESIGSLDRLEGRHIGLVEAHRRDWPSLPTARTRVSLVLFDQKLSGWVSTSIMDDAIYVNLPSGTDPVRHLILLERYIPYRCTVKLRFSRPRGSIVGDTIIIRARKD